MFFAGLIIFLVCTLYLPWYAIMIAAAVMGWTFNQASIKQHLSLAMAAGFANVACAFFDDGRNYGLISKRMSGMFSLPSSYGIFAVMFMLAFVSVILWLRAGMALRQVKST